jgi:hypothetical protein
MSFYVAAVLKELFWATLVLKGSNSYVCVRSPGTKRNYFQLLLGEASAQMIPGPTLGPQNTVLQKGS